MSEPHLWPIPYGDGSTLIGQRISTTADRTSVISLCLVAAQCPGNHADKIVSRSLSTSEAEYVAASQYGQEVVCLREILRDNGFTRTGPTRIYQDHLACVAMSENPVLRKY